MFFERSQGNRIVSCPPWSHRPKFDKKTLTSHGRSAMCQVVHFDHWRKVVDWLRENVIANIEEEGLAKKENDIEKAKEPENGSF